MKRRQFMKAVSALPLAGGLLAGCGKKSNETADPSTNPSNQITEQKGENMTESLAGKKTLVVYFSHTGNTRTMAEMIQKKTNGDIFEIVTVDKYPDDYDTVVAQAKKEQEANFRPKLKTTFEKITEYDVVFVGSPSWWGTFSMAVMTFLESVDLAGKTVIPFITHEGSALGRAPADLKKLCASSPHLPGHAVFGSRVKSAEGQIAAWLDTYYTPR